MPKLTIEGKPRLFFSENAPDEPWRLKEKVVALIESYFQGYDDLYTYSSMRLPNIVGDPTEVDVAFSSLSDPTDFFEFIQVRDRRGTEGRPWVEQIMGQRRSLGIDAGIMVSTTSFSDQAIRLSRNERIPLRLLLPETDENIRSWYKADFIGLQAPVVEIAHCSILVATGDRIYELRADRSRSREHNILVATSESGRYRAISLARVLDVDIMQNEDRKNRFLANVPKDESFHRATVAIEYEEPRLFAHFAGSVSGDEHTLDEILPIRGIVFFVMVNRRFVNHPIVYRYKYLDAASEELLAQAILSEMSVEEQQYYASLVRHSFDKHSYSIGGALFR